MVRAGRARRPRANEPLFAGTAGSTVTLQESCTRAGRSSSESAATSEVHALVAQGAEPIGQPWTVTDCDSNMLRTIGTRPAVDVLRETLDSLGEETRERAERNLLVGLAMDEYRHEYGRGDYLIRNIMGLDRQSGAIAINAHPRVGQTIQFQFRDAEAATCGITALLHDLKSLVRPSAGAPRRDCAAPQPDVPAGCRHGEVLAVARAPHYPCFSLGRACVRQSPLTFCRSLE